MNRDLIHTANIILVEYHIIVLYISTLHLSLSRDPIQTCAFLVAPLALIPSKYGQILLVLVQLTSVNPIGINFGVVAL